MKVRIYITLLFGCLTAGSLAVHAQPVMSAQHVIFEDNYANDAEGRMPGYWKTHGTGATVTVAGVPGKWLKMNDRTSYQLDTLLELPEKFTLEFELLTRSDNAKDLRDIHFGFTKSPTPKSYIYGVQNDPTIVVTKLQYFYNAVSSTSFDTGVKNRENFPLDDLGNARIPIVVEVNGQQMRVLVNQQAVLDTEALKVESPKHFYISNDNSRNGAQFYFGNFRITR
ncbi:hypothetical protein ACFOET_21095 [Parapedobacter deserti]|uniref:3-keto-disaccharide hydrolase domain-containing protein n=1 Tax=Parapedobacter deserti TaxID=1912957 RepID=A0ABV7JQ51_9SPHI